MGQEQGVNITVGLPVVRTSVDHGTAVGIAGTGRADERSMLEATRQAVALAPRRAAVAARACRARALRIRPPSRSRRSNGVQRIRGCAVAPHVHGPPRAVPDLDLETRTLNERTIESTPGDSAALLADLTDLLQLEHDALPAYSVAIAGLRRPDLRETLEAYRSDHERHVQDLSAQIRRLGGVPLALPHLPTGLLKLAVQMAGLPGGDRAVLLAFVSNEWQSQEKYARYAARPYPPELAALLQRHAADEARHYAWACGALEGLGCGSDTPVGQATQAFARLHGTTADTIEALGRGAIEATVRALRPTT